MNKVKLVIVGFVGKGRDNATITVTDDGRVVSDCTRVIEFGGCLVPITIDRKIQQRV